MCPNKICLCLLESDFDFTVYNSMFGLIKMRLRPRELTTTRCWTKVVVGKIGLKPSIRRFTEPEIRRYSIQVPKASPGSSCHPLPTTRRLLSFGPCRQRSKAFLSSLLNWSYTSRSENISSHYHSLPITIALLLVPPFSVSPAPSSTSFSSSFFFSYSLYSTHLGPFSIVFSAGLGLKKILRPADRMFCECNMVYSCAQQSSPHFLGF